MVRRLNNRYSVTDANIALQALSERWPIKRIAKRLGLTERTVKKWRLSGVSKRYVDEIVNVEHRSAAAKTRRSSEIKAGRELAKSALVLSTARNLNKLSPELLSPTALKTSERRFQASVKKNSSGAKNLLDELRKETHLTTRRALVVLERYQLDTIREVFTLWHYL